MDVDDDEKICLHLSLINDFSLSSCGSKIELTF